MFDEHFFESILTRRVAGSLTDNYKEFGINWLMKTDFYIQSEIIRISY